MADSEALRHLTGGVTEWNAYRAQSRGNQDLTHIELRDASFRGADFSNTDFDGSRFVDCDFEAAGFVGARLNGFAASQTLFRHAVLDRAELKGVDLKQVCLRGCNLRGVTAFDFKVRHSDLSRIRFDDATLRFTHIYNSDFRQSTLANATLQHVVFKRVLIEAERVDALAAAGIAMELPNAPTPSEWLDWDHRESLTKRAADPLVVYDGRAYWINDGRWDFFISHVSVDKEAVARPLAEALRARGQRVWYDEHEVRVGDNLSSRIDAGTKASLFGVTILSREFFGRRWTEREWAALSRKRLFLVLHGVTPEEARALRPGLDDYAFGRSDGGIDALADSLMAAIRQPPVVEQAGGATSAGALR